MTKLTKQDIESLRVDYAKHSLSEKEIDQNPFTQFDLWFHEAVKTEVMEPEHVT